MSVQRFLRFYAYLLNVDSPLQEMSIDLWSHEENGLAQDQHAFEIDDGKQLRILNMLTVQLVPNEVDNG